MGRGASAAHEKTRRPNVALRALSYDTDIEIEQE